MCKYCEDISQKERVGIYSYIEHKSLPNEFGNLIGISLHYKFDMFKKEKIVYRFPHFCPMCGKKIELKD